MVRLLIHLLTAVSITETSGGGSGWTAFGAVALVLAFVVALLGLGLWFARRQRVTWLPTWLQGPRGAHHSVENLAYSRHHNTDRWETRPTHRQITA